MEKTFKNYDDSEIVVRLATGINHKSGWLVEMVHKSGTTYVVAAWERKKEGPELRAVGNRLTNIDYSFDVMYALKYGQKLAELAMESNTSGDAGATPPHIQ